MTTQLDTAKRSRASIQGQLTRYLGRFNLTMATMDHLALSSMLTSISELERKFLQAGARILELKTVRGEQVPDEIPTSEAYNRFMDNLEDLRDRIHTLIEERKPQPEQSISMSSSKSRTFRLPKLELPKFSGEFTQWFNFKNEFLSLVEDADLNDIDRLRFLRTALCDEPRRIIESLEITEANYKVAWEALMGRYDDTSMVFRAHINAILYLQGESGPRMSVERHRKLLDDARAHYRALLSLGTVENIAENFMICLLLQKIDAAAQEKYEEQSDEEIASWDNFTSFYEKYISTMEKVSQTKLQAKGEVGKKPQPVQDSRRQPGATSTSVNDQPSTSQRTYLIDQNFNDYALIGSALVNVLDAKNEPVPIRAFLDSGSTTNLVSDRLARLVNANVVKGYSKIGGVGNSVAGTTRHCALRIGSRTNDMTFTIHAATLPKVSESYPPHTIDISKWNLPPDFQLADPSFNKPQRIDLLIGAGLFWQILRSNRIPLGPRLPLLQDTDFGYVVVGLLGSGQVPLQRTLTASVQGSSIDEQSLNELVQRFWEVDSLPTDQPKSLSADDQFCEDLFISTTKRDETGRYFVQLPFRGDAHSPVLKVSELGSTYHIARQRFLNLERKLSRDPQTKQMYVDFIQKYERLGHLEKVPDFDFKKPHYVIPHHCVLKPTSSTTKLRVVFDASCKSSSGLSLNDVLYPGPKIQEDLFVILLRLRLFKFAATADIQKMYRQVMVDPSHTDFQLILWRESETDPIQVLRLLTVTYGTAPGAYLAIRALQQLARDESEKFPLGAEVLLKNFYVDDALDLWKLKLGWVDELKPELQDRWSRFVHELIELKKVQAPRYVLHESNPSRIELHGFSDASEKAYGPACTCDAFIALTRFHAICCAPNHGWLQPKHFPSPARTMCCENVEPWPKDYQDYDLDQTVEEARVAKFALVAFESTDLTASMSFSTDFRGTRRAFANVLRFIANCRERARFNGRSRPKSTLIVPPTISNEILAEELFIKSIQRTAFPREYTVLVNHSEIPTDSKLRSLEPIMADGLIRVGGRIKKASMPLDARHQILLPKDHLFTNLLVSYFHSRRVAHMGPKMTLNSIRTRYWPVGGRQLKTKQI
uniref:CSON000605 protein n=1 Tax=Culicoides sonorensis TaxID=179676 RepID=A0A336MSH8_CULSO